MLISMVYDSGSGHTAKLAHAAGEGLRSVSDADADLIAVAEGTIP